IASAAPRPRAACSPCGASEIPLISMWMLLNTTDFRRSGPGHPASAGRERGVDRLQGPQGADRQADLAGGDLRVRDVDPDEPAAERPGGLLAEEADGGDGRPGAALDDRDPGAFDRVEPTVEPPLLGARFGGVPAPVP